MIFVLPRGEDAAAEAQSGNATALESGAKGKEGLVNAFTNGVSSETRWSGSWSKK